MPSIQSSKPTIHISPSILNSMQALEDGAAYMSPFTFKSQLLGLEPMSEAALAGTAVHAAAFESEVLPEIGNWIVADEVTQAMREATGFKPGDGGIPEVPFIRYFPEYNARLSGRCDVLYDYRTVEAKSTGGERGMRPNVDRYRRLPQTLAYAMVYLVPCEIYVVHIKKSKPRTRPKGTFGLIELAPGIDPVQKAVVEPTKEVQKTLDEWIAKTVWYISQDEEMLLHCLKKGEREIKEL